MSRESTYIRRNIEINGWRSGVNSKCPKCGAVPTQWCRSKDGSRTLSYNHIERRRIGKAMADAIVVARGKVSK